VYKIKNDNLGKLLQITIDIFIFVYRRNGAIESLGY